MPKPAPCQPAHDRLRRARDPAIALDQESRRAQTRRDWYILKPLRNFQTQRTGL